MQTYTHSDELNHHGILGMKWGVRRTKAQLARARGKKAKDGPDSEKEKGVTINIGSKSKSVKDMTDSELRERIARLELEKRYKDLNPEKVSRGKDFIDKAVFPAVNEAGKQLARDFIVKQGKKVLGLDTKEGDDLIKELRKEFDALDLKKKIKDLKSPDPLKDLKSEKERLQLENDIRKLKKGKSIDDPYEDLKNERDILQLESDLDRLRKEREKREREDK